MDTSELLTDRHQASQKAVCKLVFYTIDHRDMLIADLLFLVKGLNYELHFLRHKNE